MIKYAISLPHSSAVKNPPSNAGDTGDAGMIPGSGQSLEKKVAIPSSILAWNWWDIVSGVAKSQM